MHASSMTIATIGSQVFRRDIIGAPDPTNYSVAAAIASGDRASSRKLGGRLLVSSLSRQRRVDSVAGNSILFGQAMREDCRDSAVKEIENSIVDVLQADS